MKAATSALLVSRCLGSSAGATEPLSSPAAWTAIPSAERERRIPSEQAVRVGALINIRPRINPQMEIQDTQIHRQVETITRTLFQGAS